MPEPIHDSAPFALSPGRPWGSRMFSAGLWALIGIEIYYAWHSEVRSPTHLQLGLLIIFFAFLPALRWAKEGRPSLPVFEVFMFTGANTYALPLLNGHRELLNYSDEDITTAALAVVFFQIIAFCTYEFTRGQAKTGSFWRDEVITRNLGQWLSYGMVLNTVYVFVSTFMTLIPDSVSSVLRAIFFGIGIICTFITSRRMGSGELSSGESAFFFINLLLQCIGMSSTLFLVGAVSVLLLALVGYVSTSGRVPLIISVGVLLVLAILHSGKSAMRTKYWENEQSSPTLVQLPEFFAEWFKEGLNRTSDDTQEKMTSKLIERTSLFHMMCLVVSTTPAQQPFLGGETYRDIPAQFIPRFFWADKPLGHVSTSKLSVYYGLQREEDTLKTTIGFGMLTEAYANYGFWGLAGIAVLLGFSFKKVKCWAADGPLFSYGGLLLVIMLAWSFQVELTLSIWLASFYQACVAVLAIPFGLSRFVQ